MKNERDVSLYPREKLATKGPEFLSDEELLAVMIGSGNHRHDVFSLAKKVLSRIDSSDEATLNDLSQISGIGLARAGVIVSALEFSRRRIRPEGLKISYPSDVIPLISHMSDRKQEYFLCVSINGANEVIKVRVVTVGIADRTLVHPREVFSDPIIDRACAVIVAHNHPSGTIEPSREDRELTQRLKQAGEILGIRLLDHIIFGKKGFYSFLEQGKL